WRSPPRYPVPRGEVRDRPRDFENAQRAARAQAEAIRRALQQRALRAAERHCAPKRARVEPSAERVCACYLTRESPRDGRADRERLTRCRGVRDVVEAHARHVDM